MPLILADLPRSHASSGATRADLSALYVSCSLHVGIAQLLRLREVVMLVCPRSPAASSEQV